MPRNDRDRLKDKRRAIFNAIDRINEHLYNMISIAGEGHETIQPMAETARDMTNLYKKALSDLLQF